MFSSQQYLDNHYLSHLVQEKMKRKDSKIEDKFRIEEYQVIEVSEMDIKEEEVHVSHPSTSKSSKNLHV
jgi:hypothetical protein